MPWPSSLGRLPERSVESVADDIGKDQKTDLGYYAIDKRNQHGQADADEDGAVPERPGGPHAPEGQDGRGQDAGRQQRRDERARRNVETKLALLEEDGSI